MIDLLEKLSRLNPKVCDRCKDGYNINCYSESGDLWMSVCLYSDDLLHELPPKPAAYIASALRQAISAHPNLRYRLQNYGVRASIWNAEDEKITFDGADKEPAIALLTSYVLWLESIDD